MKSSEIATCGGAGEGGGSRVDRPRTFRPFAATTPFKLTKVVIAEGQQVVWTLGQDGFVDVILPPGPGGSAGITQAAASPPPPLRAGRPAFGDHDRDGQEIRASAPDGAELAALDVHVSARGADGKTFAGFIRTTARFEGQSRRRGGPVRERVPLQKGDCVIYVDLCQARRIGF